MNYKSQMRGWAVDRALELMKNKDYLGSVDFDTLQSESAKILDYVYEAREDMVSTAQHLYDLIRNAAPGEANIEAVRISLEAIEAERVQAGLDEMPAETAH